MMTSEIWNRERFSSQISFFQVQLSRMGHIFLPSNALLGTNVTQVSADDNEKDEILYEIGSDAEGKFSIDRTTGWITSNETIDREVWYHKLVGLFAFRDI